MQSEGKNLEQIVEITGLTKYYLRKFYLKKEKEIGEKRLNMIKKAFKKFYYIEDAAELVGETSKYLYNICLRNDINPLPFRNPKSKYLCKKVKRNKLRDILIRRGLTLDIIANKTGVSRERVRHYIISIGEYDHWRESSEHYHNKTSYNKDDLEKKSIITSLINGVIGRKKSEVSEQEKFAFEKAIEWHEKIRSYSNNYSFGKIYDLMMDYWEVKNNGKKKSIMKFGEENNFNFVSISRIFRTLGLKTLVNRYKVKENLSFDEKETIGRAYEVKMNYNDLSYFLKVPYYTISQRFRKRKEKRDEIYIPIIQFKKPTYECRLYYRTASQIYEAENAGFSKNETLELLSINNEVYDFAINNKDKISNFIINSLKVLYPKREIQNPWIN